MRDADLGSCVRSVLAWRKDLDATSIAEALWLAATRAGLAPGSRSSTADLSAAVLTAGHEDSRPIGRGPDPPAPRPAPPREAAASLAQPPTRVPGDLVAVQRARARAEPLDLARSLRPFKQRWTSGRRSRLDLDATVASYARSWHLIPEFRPAPERWFEVSLVVDDSPSMAVWNEAVSNLDTMLRHLGAFRRIRSWRLSVSEPAPLLRDAHGHSYTADHLRAPHARRLIIVVSDASAPGWFRPEIWHAMRTWAASTPTALISPLATRLWRRTSLDLPAVRARSAGRGGANSLLRYSVPSSLRSLADTQQWRPLPIATFSPYMLGNWARTLMRGDPEGCDALLIPATGRPAEDADPLSTPPPGAAVVRAFLRSASPLAVRLATLCAPFASVSLPLLHFIRHELVPAASTTDLAEVIVGGLFLPLEDTVLRYRDDVRPHLQQLLAEPDAWHVYEVLKRHVADQRGAGVTFPAVVPGGRDDAALPEELEAFATASRDTLEFLDATEPEPTATRPLDPAEDEPDAPTGAQQEEDDITISDSTHPVPYVWGGVPPRNKDFTGRAEILAQLRRHDPRAEGLPRVLTGLGGIGKTAAAIEYAYRYQSGYDIVWWIPADQLPLVRSSLAQLAGHLGLEGAATAGIEGAAAAALEALRRGEPFDRWLVVFDNADRPDDFRDYLPTGGGNVLITSRNPSWETVAERVAVNVFTREESLEFLARRTPRLAPADAALLADKLGDLPLALDQAGAMLHETGMPATEYLRLLDERILLIMAEGRSSEYPLSMAAAWKLAVDKARQLLPEALELLRTCAFFGPDPIPWNIFRGTTATANPAELGFVNDPILLARAIRELGRFGLVTVRDQAISMHRLDQAMLRSELDERQQEKYRHEAHLILAGGAPSDPSDTSLWPRFAELLPHVTSPVLELPGCQHRSVRDFALTMLRYLYLSGDAATCWTVAQRFTERWAADSGPDDPFVLRALAHASDASLALGRYPEALAIAQQALSLAQTALGERDPATLALRTAVGAALRARGDFLQAMHLDLETRAWLEESSERSDPRVLGIVCSLAIDRELSIADYREARELYAQVYRAWAQGPSGVSAPEILVAWVGLARTTRLSGHYAEAGDIAEEALDFARDKLGPSDHPGTLNAMVELSIVLRRLGSERALLLASQAQDQSTKVLGSQHPITLAATISLWNAQRASGQLDTPLYLSERAMDLLTRVYGPNHPFTFACTGNLAVLRRLTGAPDEARQLNETALAGLDDRLGRDHHYSLIVAANLGSDLAALGDVAAARRLGADTLMRSSALLGADHPHTLGCASNLALDLRADGADDEARSLAEDTRSRYAATVGRDQPDALAAEAGLRVDFDFDPPPMG